MMAPIDWDGWVFLAVNSITSLQSPSMITWLALWAKPSSQFALMPMASRIDGEVMSMYRSALQKRHVPLWSLAKMPIAPMFF